MGSDHETHAAEGRVAASFRVRAVHLTVKSGPDAGQSVRLDVPTFVVGTGERADLRLTDSTVSREHLRLSLGPAGVHVRDEGSKNGTWVGGVSLRDATITADTVLTLGQTTIALLLESAPIDLPLSAEGRFGDAIGVSPPMRHLFAVLERAAKSDITVLLEGESGVGKEVLARALHTQSPRVDGPFVAVDCGAIAPTLIESELFGHERGAFTGAQRAHRGFFEQADGGTLFLDEIGELSIDLQPKLLRVLETREVRALGSKTVRAIDVRVVAATNRRLSEAAQKGEFRKDLFYRLAVARVTIPPLRDRPDDVAPLARAFFHKARGLDDEDLPADFLAMLASYAWPGNVRELRNVIERYALLGTRDSLALFDPSHGPSDGAGDRAGEDLSHLPFHEARQIVLERFERRYLPKVLERAGGVVSKAAQLADVARPSFYRMLERLDGKVRED